MKRIVCVLFGSIFLLAAGLNAQSTPPDVDLAHETLRLNSNVDLWRKTLAEIKVDVIPVPFSEQRLIAASRESCSSWFDTLQQETSKRQQRPDLTAQVVLLVSVLQTQHCIEVLAASLTNAYRAARESAKGTLESAGWRTLRWANEVGKITSELRGVYENVEFLVTNELATADEKLALPSCHGG